MKRLTLVCQLAALLLLAACFGKDVDKNSALPSKDTALGTAPLQLQSGHKAAATAPQEDHNKETKESPLHQDEPKEHEPIPSRIRLQSSVLAAAKIRTEKVLSKALPMTLEAPGEVAADPDRSVRVTARVPGRISTVLFKEGLRVQTGALLAIIDSAELARTASTYTSAAARVLAAQKNAARLESLTTKGLAGNQELLEAQTQAQVLQAEAQAARRSLLSFGLSDAQLSNIGARFELRAPLTGYAMNRSAVIGQTVPAEHILCDLIDLDHAYFIARLYEKNLARVRPGQTAEVRLNAYPDAVFVGIVESVGKQLDATARTVVTRIAITNKDDLLKVGLFGKARISLGDEREQGRGLVVPLSAVTRIADRDVVFVRQPDEHFEVHPVTLGPSASGEVQVLSGLREGEQVVTEGVFTLKGAILKSTFAEEE